MSTGEMQKHLNQLNEERNLSKKQNEDYKKSISEEIKKYKQSQIVNNDLVEKKYSLWERILRTLGMN
jgi:phage regulator Rha-like protein